MFGCGIGGLGKKFGFRRHRSHGRKNKHLENFEQLYSERIDYASSCCSDLPRPDDVEMQWTPHPSRGHRHVMKHGLDMEDNASPITVNPHEVTFGNTLGKGASGRTCSDAKCGTCAEGDLCFCRDGLSWPNGFPRRRYQDSATARRSDQD